MLSQFEVKETLPLTDGTASGTAPAMERRRAVNPVRAQDNDWNECFSALTFMVFV